MALDFSLFSTFQVVRQAEHSECGLACLAMIANHFGQRTDITTLRRAFEPSARGATARDLSHLAGQLGLVTRTIRCELDDLSRIRLPAILHWDLGHFVVLYKATGKYFHIADPSGGVQRLTSEAVSPHFSGIAIEFSMKPEFERRAQEKPMSLRKLTRIGPAMLRSFGQAFLLSLLMQGALLLTPLYMQFVIDEGVQRGDADVLGIMLIGVLAVYLFLAAANFLRGLTIQFITQSMSFDMNSATFNHLIRLPHSYFQKRQIGDVQQRFRSLAPIQQAIGSGAITSVIDGLLSILLLAFMMIYSPILTMVSLAFIAAVTAVRVLSLRASRNAASAVLVADAREQTRFLETLRAMPTIKVNAAESTRLDFWRNAAAATINANIQRGNLVNGTAALTQFLQGCSDAVVIFLAAKLALSGEFTIGVMTAFLAYKAIFSSRVSALVDQLIVFSLLDVQLERVSDIVMTSKEHGTEETAGETMPIDGPIEVQGVGFRYSAYDPMVLRNVNLRIEAGEFIAITGPSGGGKSTLMRLILGLNPPTEGTITFAGKNIADIPVRALRQSISVVLQDDQLLSGTILDNVTIFSESPDLDRVNDSLEKAGIADDLNSLPMKLGTLIGDMGSSLSGGQRQRILIARALYRQPRILIMDEGTSHLDLRREEKVNEALRRLDITRIVVAHRPETIRAADRIYMLDAGTVRPFQSELPK